MRALVISRSKQREAISDDAASCWNVTATIQQDHGGKKEKSTLLLGVMTGASVPRSSPRP